MNRLTKNNDTKERTTIGMPKAVACYWKLKEYEDIEELYGCPLIAVFEALENGAWVKDEMWGLCHWTMPYIARDYDSRNTPKATLYLAFEKSGQKRYFALKDFGKTWSIRKEDLENGTHRKN